MTDAPVKRSVHRTAPSPIPEPQAGGDREELGRMVREIWIKWAQRQPNPKSSWLAPWGDLAEPDKEVDRQIGEALYTAGRARGIEEERKRCERIARSVETHYVRQIVVEQQSGAYQGEVVATAKRNIGKEIADAIAKETP